MRRHRDIQAAALPALPALLSAAGLLLCGCHGQISVGNIHDVPSTSKAAEHVVPQSALEQITAQQIRDKVGGGNVVVTCTRPLPIKMGATENCSMAQDSKQVPVTLTITKVKGPDDASWE